MSIELDSMVYAYISNYSGDQGRRIPGTQQFKTKSGRTVARPQYNSEVEYLLRMYKSLGSVLITIAIIKQ